MHRNAHTKSRKKTQNKYDELQVNELDISKRRDDKQIKFAE